MHGNGHHYWVLLPGKHNTSSILKLTLMIGLFLVPLPACQLCYGDEIHLGLNNVNGIPCKRLSHMSWRLEMGLIQSSFGIWSDTDVNYWLDIGQTTPIRIPFHSLQWTMNVLCDNFRLQEWVDSRNKERPKTMKSKKQLAIWVRPSSEGMEVM